MIILQHLLMWTYFLQRFFVNYYSQSFAPLIQLCINIRFALNKTKCEPLLASYMYYLRALETPET